MDRAQERSELEYLLILLFGPLLDLVNHPERHTEQDLRRVRARFEADYDAFAERLDEFSDSEPGCSYFSEAHEVHMALRGAISATTTHPLGSLDLVRAVREAMQSSKATLLAIPASPNSAVMAAHTPFSSYCKLKDLCSSAATRLILADPYVSAEVLYRYLRDVSASVMSTLLTSAGKGWGKGEYEAFLDASRLYAAERGASAYRLVVNDTFHDRHLVCDDAVYLLGGSVKHAGFSKPCTVQLVGEPTVIVEQISDLLDLGAEMFGPAQTAHL